MGAAFAGLHGLTTAETMRSDDCPPGIGRRTSTSETARNLKRPAGTAGIRTATRLGWGSATLDGARV